MHIYRSHHHDVPGFCCAGDGRNDSPGHSAQYLQYTLMEEESSDIMCIEFVDKREADLKSPNMEPIGLRRSIEALKGDGLIITEVVTDAHVQITQILGKYTLMLTQFLGCSLQHVRSLSVAVCLQLPQTHHELTSSVGWWRSWSGSPVALFSMASSTSKTKLQSCSTSFCSSSLASSSASCVPVRRLVGGPHVRRNVLARLSSLLQ